METMTSTVPRGSITGSRAKIKIRDVSLFSRGGGPLFWVGESYFFLLSGGGSQFFFKVF